MFIANVHTANAREILHILNQYPLLLIKTLSSMAIGSSVQLSMPTDGKGARIKVSVPPEDVAKVPKSTVITVEGEEIKIPLEASGDYQDYVLQ
jgi:hypothetical protein